MLILICFGCLIASLLITHKFIKGKLFNPIVMFFGISLLQLAVFQLNSFLGVFYSGISHKMTLIYSLSFLFFLLGAMIGIAVPKTIKSYFEITIDKQRLDAVQKMVAILFPFFVLGVLWKYQIVIGQYGGLFHNIIDIRSGIQNKEFSFPLPIRFLTTLAYPIILNLGILVVMRSKPILFLLSAVVILLSFVNDSTTGSRGSTFNTVLLFVSAALICGSVKYGTLRARHLLIGLCTMLTGILLITVILFLRSDQSVGFIQRFSNDNFTYFVGTLPATSYFLDNPWPSSVPLQWTLAGLYQTIDMVFGWTGFRILNQDTFTTFYAPITSVGPFNSASYLAVFYSDAKELGVLILSGVLGFGSAYAFLKAVVSKRILDIQVAAIFMFAVIFSSRGVPTSGISFWITILIIFIQSHLFLPHSKKFASPIKKTSAAHLN